MKQAADQFTRDLIDKPGRGRPRKPNAMTDAQRAREYRARKRAEQTASTWPATRASGAPWWPWGADNVKVSSTGALDEKNLPDKPATTD